MSKDHQDDPYGFDDARKDEEREILFRLDERTERIDQRLERIHGRVEEQQMIIDNHDDRIQRNTTILNAITFGSGALLTTVLAKLQGIIKL